MARILAAARSVPAAAAAATTATTERGLAIGIAIIRITFGLIFLTNGIAKLPGQWDGIHPFPGFLITRDSARGILEFDVQTHPVGLYKRVIDNVVLAHWGVFGAFLTATELAIGICLVLGILTPVVALMGAGFALHLNFANWDRNVWAWEYAVEWLPLIALALMRAGRYKGLDARLAARFPRWPIT
jgi:uncharacterized membrane protein YphA (DoxX/SURF4 family)